MIRSGALGELLNDMNPSIKGLTVITGVILMSLAFDPVTVSVSLIYILMITVIFGRISWRRWLFLFVPFFILAIGYFWTAALFPRSDLPQDSPLLLSWGPLKLTVAGFNLALSLALRTLMFSALSLLFVLTTEPVKFMLSLMQQCKLPPKLAYGILAGFRFLPCSARSFSLCSRPTGFGAYGGRSAISARRSMLSSVTVSRSWPAPYANPSGCRSHGVARLYRRQTGFLLPNDHSSAGLDAHGHRAGRHRSGIHGILCARHLDVVWGPIIEHMKHNAKELSRRRQHLHWEQLLLYSLL